MQKHPYPLDKIFPPTIRKTVFTRQTIQQLLFMAEKETGNHPVLYTSRLIIRELTKRHPISEGNACLWYVRQYIRYQHDPDGIELVFGPSEMVRMINEYGSFSEDCDSQAALLYSLLRAIGHKVRLACFNFTGSDKIDHVNVEDFIGNDWFMLDSILDPPEVKQMLKLAVWKETYCIPDFANL